MSASTLNPATFPAHATGDSPTSANYNARWNAVVAAVNNHAGLIDTHVDIRNFGARGWGESAIDSTSAIQAALNFGGDVYIPPLANDDYYRITSTLSITGPLRLFGAGYTSKIAVASTFPTDTDIIRIVPSALRPNMFYKLERFNISREPGNVPRDGVHIDLTGIATANAILNFDIDRVYIDQTGRSSFRLTNPTNPDGFVASSIRGCELQSGIYLQNAGDSVLIKDNVLSNTKIGIESSFTSGAAQIIIENNNITSPLGAILLHNGIQVKILRNQIEQVVANGAADAACIWVKGDTAQIASCEIRGNNINTMGNALFCIDVQDAKDSIIAENDMVGYTHVRVGASALRTVIDSESNKFYNTSYAHIPMVISDSGSGTVGPWRTPTLLNSWVQVDAANYPVRYAKSRDGIVTIRGQVKDGTVAPMFVLPVGFRPATGQYFAVSAKNTGVWATGNLLVDAGGTVAYVTGTAETMALDISFRAAA